MLSWFPYNQLRSDDDGRKLQRALTLTGCILAALAGGTNYVFSAYAPQLGARLKINHTELNTIALAGNIGVYSSGPLWGSVVDARGPSSLYVIAVVLLFTGYFGIKLFYDGVFQLPAGPNKSLSFAFSVIMICAFLSGAGGNSGLTASVNATAKSFSDKRRSTAVGVVISGFGLSAFFFSTLAHTAFSDDASAFLTVLAFGTTVPMIIAFFTVKIVPQDESNDSSSDSAEYTILGGDDQDDPDNAFRRRFDELEDERHAHSHDTGDTPAPSRLSLSDSNLRKSRSRMRSDGSFRSLSPVSSSLEPAEFGSPMSPPTLHRQRMSLSHIDETAVLEREDGRAAHLLDAKPVSPTDSFAGLLSSGDFWLMFGIVSLLSGTGLMWINNVGSIAQALVAQGNPDSWDRARAAKLQASQVSIVSVMNCLGRIAIGLIADFAKHRYSIRRITFLIPISFIFILSQITASHTSLPSSLYISSALLGSAYGAMFSLAPLIILEWFGMERFSRNWGTVAISPVVGGNIFSLMFGRNLDRHAAKEPVTATATSHAVRATVEALLRRGGVPDPNSDHQCFEGLECYVSSLHVTTFASVIALLLTVGALLRDKNYAQRDMMQAESRRGTGSNTPVQRGEQESLLQS